MRTLPPARCGGDWRVDRNMCTVVSAGVEEGAGAAPGTGAGAGAGLGAATRCHLVRSQKSSCVETIQVVGDILENWGDTMG